MSLKAEIQNLQAQISDQVSYVPCLFFQIKKYYVFVCLPVGHALSIYLPLTVSLQAASQMAFDQFQKRCVLKWEHVLNIFAGFAYYLFPPQS